MQATQLPAMQLPLDSRRKQSQPASSVPLALTRSQADLSQNNSKAAKPSSKADTEEAHLSSSSFLGSRLRWGL